MKTMSNGNRGLWWSGLLVAGVFGVAAGLTGCEGSKPADPASGSAAPAAVEGTGQAQGAATAAAGSATSCADYAKKVCEISGEGSDLCTATQKATTVMSPAACAAALADTGTLEAQVSEQKKKCEELMDKLCKDLGEDTQTCAMVREKTPQFPPSRCEEMLGQYEPVLAELKAMEESNKPLDAAKQAQLVAGNPASWGPADAKVTVVEFSDFQCPYCTKAAEMEQKLKEKYSDKVRFVFRHFPLPFHKEAFPASAAAIEAQRQGKFWEMHDKLFANQAAIGRADLEKYAGEIGLDVERVKMALDTNAHDAQVTADIELGKAVGVQGTPTLFINGARVNDPGNFEAVSKLIDAELAK
jgi:protein-disulfide isomerase